jgi:hypothetical protein
MRPIEEVCFRAWFPRSGRRPLDHVAGDCRQWDPGHCEYSAVATNPPQEMTAPSELGCGHGAQAKAVAELNGHLALDVVPTRHSKRSQAATDPAAIDQSGTESKS